MNAPKLWRGRTLDARSAERREQLVDVGFELLGTDGSAAVTMRAVTRLANLSPRYFYESFADRRALIVAVYDRLETELLTRLSTVDPGGDLHTTIRAALQICAAYFEEDPRRARVLLREPLTDDALRAHSADRLPAFLRTMVPALGEEVGALIPDSEETLAIIGTALGGALVALYVDWIDGRLPVPRDRLVDTATALVLSLVRTPT
ncbi:TetR/AcrR family transcriptional regulator [Nocardia zapadnayensis]|uniref:TetR/AcrR family transcriptional regulator n=1 Tax=Nocardia rhamnosiphila TaxID=426716 RepID=UPI0022455071|nr:TetR/AcrR family transcriptional regulator [Nocardia zapadnayensis]MCX0274267.1 TetR/AcrR family transcriptional regulator [Nocardia zapadnayensis]